MRTMSWGYPVKVKWETSLNFEFQLPGQQLFNGDGFSIVVRKADPRFVLWWAVAWDAFDWSPLQQALLKFLGRSGCCYGACVHGSGPSLDWGSAEASGWLAAQHPFVVVEQQFPSRVRVEAFLVVRLELLWVGASFFLGPGLVDVFLRGKTLVVNDRLVLQSKVMLARLIDLCRQFLIGTVLLQVAARANDGLLLESVVVSVVIVL